MDKESFKLKKIHNGVSLKKLFIIVGVVLLIGVVLGRRGSHAAYKSTITVPLVNGKITYKKPDFQTIAMYQQASAGSSTYNEITKMPTSGYSINETKSYCNLNGTKDTNARMYTNSNGEHVFTGFSKGEKCYIYFDVASNKVSDILAKYTKNTSRNGEITASFKENTPTTVYSKEDDAGTSYVFAGENPNNWVKLGNLYFRIIRFNGDGTMRLIYSGEGSAATTGTGTQIGTKVFNTSDNDNIYVGLQYTSGEMHGTDQNSVILGEENSTDITTLYGWYNSKIKPNYVSLIDTNAGFCSDREPSTNNNSSNGSIGLNGSFTYYGAYIRYMKGAVWQEKYTTMLKCKNASDNLKLPVGLITADEYALAGGGSYANSSYYNTTFWLHTGENYWTMTPYRSSGIMSSRFLTDGSETAMVFYVNSGGYFGSNGYVTYKEHAVRPVINLKSSTTFEEGDGTSGNPYVVKI